MASENGRTFNYTRSNPWRIRIIVIFLEFMNNLQLPDEVESLWIATTPNTSYPEFPDNITVDVAVIGGGIAGLNAAYFLKRKGLKVAVLEATYIVTGTSGNTTAKVTSQHELKYAYIQKNFGEENAKIYADSNQWAISELARIIYKENIRCDFHIMPAYTYSKTREGADEIKEEVETAKTLNLPASFVDSNRSVPFKIYGAIKFDNQAYFHPRKYLLAIAGKINTGGSYIFEKTPASDIEEHEDSCEIVTEKKKVKAKYAVIATNYPFYDKENLFSQMQEIRSYVLAVKPRLKLPEGMFIGTGENDLSFRPQKIGKEAWQLVGGVHHPSNESGDANKNYEQLKQYAQKYFDIKRIDFKWAAQDSKSPDRIPYIGKMPKRQRIFVTTGFGAWGMTTSFVSARILTDLITGEKNDWKDFYSPSRIKPEKRSNIKYSKKQKRSDLMEIMEDEGKVMDKDGKQIAVYKDKSGKLITVSAVCTHLGCIVGWNDGDKTWDCPCHGSRFNKEGKVIHGPAVKDLPKIELDENLKT